MAWTLVGAPTFSAATEAVELGPVRVPLVGGLSVKLSTPIAPPVSYGYMVLSYLSSYGEELGRIQVWPRELPTSYLMGAGLRVRDPFGVLVLRPGTLNRRWLVAGFPVVVRVLADLPTEADADSLTPPGFVGPSGTDLFFTPTGGAARIALPQ
jgi:hypothetical protein